MKPKLSIGSAQFGMNYGVSNKAGRTPKSEVAAILSAAKDMGINSIDTAIAYGDAEQVLGDVGVKDWKLTTKVPTIPDSVDCVDSWLETQVRASLERLRVSQLHGILLHRPCQLATRRGHEIARGLERLVSLGLTDRIGASIQSPASDLPIVLDHIQPGIIQSPLNLLDRSLVDDGHAERLAAMGCEVHARSVFLQGLLLMAPAQRPTWTQRWSETWEEFDLWLRHHSLSSFDACLSYVGTQDHIDKVVVGIDSIDQLIPIASFQPITPLKLPTFSSEENSELIDPSQWPRHENT